MEIVRSATPRQFSSQDPRACSDWKDNKPTIHVQHAGLDEGTASMSCKAASDKWSKRLRHNNVDLDNLTTIINYHPHLEDSDA
jgi:hypothetical protein